MQHINQTDFLPLGNIYLDPNNYRFRDVSHYVFVEDDAITAPAIQRRTRDFLTGKNNENIKDLVASFKKSGFLPVDQLQVVQLSKDVYKVIEGNRRIATLKLLQEESQNDRDIGALDPAIFGAIPVVYYGDGNDSHYRIIMGLKHINGNKRWPLVNQAQLMKDMSDNGMSEQDIVNSLGITVSRFRRTMRTLALIELYKKSDYGDQFRAEMFNVFDATVNSQNVKDWLGFDNYTKKVDNQTNLERFFSWLSDIPGEELDVEEEEYENISQSRAPIIRTNRDVREIAKFIGDEDALKLIEEGHSIYEAYLSSEQVGKDQFDTTLNLLQQNLNTALQYSSYATKDHAKKFEKIQNKLKGLIATQGLTETLLPQATKPRTLFAFQISKHFSDMTIQTFKGLKQVYIKELNRINIFAGDNNVGKTSVLEAIRLLVAQNDTNDLLRSQQLRGKFFSGKLPPQWVQENVPNTIQIQGNFGIEGQKASILIQQRMEEIELSSDYLGSIFLEGQFLGDTHEGHIRLFDNNNKPFEMQAKTISHLCPFAYISPFGGYWDANLFDAHAISIQEKQHLEVLDFLKESIDEDILDVRLVEKYGLKRFLVEKTNETIDLSQFGDGLQHIFKTIIQFASTQHGIVLIDEIETAIHHSLMIDYSRFIQKLARKFNTQVFITSHSDEYINAFVDNESYNNDISMYRLVREDAGMISCKYISGDRYKELSRVMGIDLRGGTNE